MKIGIPDDQHILGVITLHPPRVSSRGNRGFRPTLANGCITGLRVVGPIPGDLTDRTGNLRQQPRKNLAIMYVARGNLHGHNLFRVLVDSQMEFAPAPSANPAMLVNVPLPGSVDSKASGINDNMTGTAI
jgi:hypothetical protein